MEHFLAFCNSAPVYFTDNGLANNAGRSPAGSYNLKPDKGEAFADFLATVLSELGAREGLRFAEISPFNEPEWSWNASKQEGSPARLRDIAGVVRLLDRKLTERRVDATIVVTESGNIDYLVKSKTDRPECENQIEALFDPASPNALTGLSHVPRRVAAHSYWTTAPSRTLRDKRVALRAKLAGRGLEYWQTELCVMANDKEIGGGGGRDLTMRTALYVARIIHYDLCVAQASAWQWWLGLSFSDYKDGLIYVRKNKDGSDGEVSDSRLLWALGNYSRFVRPGSVRVDVTGRQADADDPEGLMVSAFLHETGRTLTVVLVNASDENRDVVLDVKGATIQMSRSYLTSDDPSAKLLPRGSGNPVSACEIPVRSIVTWVGRF